MPNKKLWDLPRADAITGNEVVPLTTASANTAADLNFISAWFNAKPTAYNFGALSVEPTVSPFDGGPIPLGAQYYNSTTNELRSYGAFGWFTPNIDALLLAAPTGATLVGTPAGTVQAAIDARPTSAALAASGGAGMVGFLQSGADAVLRTTQDKQRERRSVEDFHSGGSDYSLAFERAIAAGIDTLYLGPVIYDHDNDLLLPNGFSIVGRSKNTSGLFYHGTGKALSLRSTDEPVIRSYSHFLANFLVMGDGRLGGTGIDMDSVSEAMIFDVTAASLTKGLAMHSDISGGSVYNRVVGFKSQNCDVGLDLFRDGVGVSSYTNDNVFNAVRANLCDIGIRISGGNHNIVTNAQVEVCDVGVDIIEPATATANANTIAFTRFESNTTANIRIGAAVTHTILEENVHIDGTPLIDAGTRTQHIGTYASATPHKRVSPYQIAEGSFRYERSANGGSGVPMLVMHEQSSINSPVTAEVHNAATSNDASFFRGRFGGDAGTIKFDIQPRSGKIRSLGTTNGPVGSFTLGAAVSTVVNNTAIAAASLIFLQPANPAAAQLVAAKGLYVSARTADTSFQVTTGDATAAAGTEIFWYWLVN